jgi:hypothetical protein
LRVQGDRREAVLRRYAQYPVRFARSAASAVVLGLLLALSGCGWFSSSSKTTEAACPSAVVLRPLSNTAVFGASPERRPDNVAFYGLLSEADLKCDYAGDAVRVTLDAIVIGERGPASKGDAVDFQYFVAVTGPDQAIISKKPFAVRIAFEGAQKRSGVTDHIEETIPLGGRKGADLNVLLGFQQSPEVVDFYKHFRGR